MLQSLRSLYTMYRPIVNSLHQSKTWYTPVATYMKMITPVIEEIEFPEKKRMTQFDKTPIFNNERVIKRTKRLIEIRGPELVHNRIVHGKFGVKVEYGCYLTWQHLNMIRNIVIKLQKDDMYGVWRIEQPWRPMTQKAKGTRMGGGKGKVKYFSYPVKAGRIIFEIGGNCSYLEVKKMLKQVTSRMPGKATIVTNETILQDLQEKQEIDSNNANPFKFVDCIRNNDLGIQTITSPYDVIWKGKYR